jgi:hypothetical protein
MTSPDILPRSEPEVSQSQNEELLASLQQRHPLKGFSVKQRRALFQRQALLSMPSSLPRPLRVRIAKVQGKIQEFVTRPREVSLDEQTLLSMVPALWSAEYRRCEELVRTCVLNDLDPQNAAGEAFRDAQRERVF